MITLLTGDCREMLQTLPAGSVQTCVTSPPYYGLRKYGDDVREIGQEATPAAYVAALVAVFAEVWRVLRD
ncbi:MAG TPA: site-specific DNA-methyltransferase, partial [Burkholderiales bacterium]|nr:site-specific DNA-methyltransferase [Burkholderiales bacterium]